MKYTRFEWWLPKLLCLIAACALWVYVMNEQNPQVENTYTVPVETRNLDRSLVATNVPSTLKVKVRMSRSDMIYMRSDNIKAYVDLAGLTDGDYPNTPILVSVPGDESVVSVTPKTFDLNVDTYAVKTLPANVQIFGTPETNFSVESNKVTPDTITIAGSSTMIAKADRAVVSVNIAGKEKSFSEFDSVNILDADGNTVTGLDVMPSQVKVTVKMKEATKLGNLPIKIETKGDPAKGYKVGKITVTPPVATLTAPFSFFANNRTFDLDPIDVTGASADIHRLVSVISLLLVGGGVIQNLKSAETVSLVEPIAVSAEGEILEDAVIDLDTETVTVDGEIVSNAQIVTEQFVPMGPAASQVAIKQTGTNGGGYMGVNSAHPLENPNAFTNLIEMISILLIPAALCFTFGSAVKNKKQGIAIFMAMFICLVVALSCIAVTEQAGTSQLAQNGAVNMSMAEQAGGNMEGKETRFGIAASSTWAAFTTAASNGSVNSMHDSYTPLAGMVTMLLMQLGEVIFGGVGCGLYGMLAFAILAVFIAGLMVGRTPEFLGKKIEPYEMKWSVLVCLATPIAILVGSGLAAVVPSVMDSLHNGGAHGFSEMLYTYSSCGGNNGSAFAGFNGNTVFLNVSLGLVMLFARFLPIIGTLAIAGSLAGKKKIATTAGTLSTTNGMFVFLLIVVVLLIGALSFFPALALGPLAEFFGSIA